ncbi:MAG: hypothetical protein Fur0022_35380 [Anaerolineales bacterium]
MKAHYFFFITLILGFVLSSCTQAEDTTYLTPIPQATLLAYPESTPIQTKLQAVISARLLLLEIRIEFAEPPRVLSVEQVSLEEAHRQTEIIGHSTSEGRPGNTEVWLVLFEGDYQIIPPDPEHTPVAPTHGCAYVIIDVKTGQREGGTVECRKTKVEIIPSLLQTLR